jgi:hypothetical protein
LTDILTLLQRSDEQDLEILSALARAVEQAMSLNPNRRQRSAAEMKDQLREVQNNLAVQNEGQSDQTRSGISPTEVAPQATLRVGPPERLFSWHTTNSWSPSEKKQRKSWRIGALLILLVLVFALVLIAGRIKWLSIGNLWVKQSSRTNQSEPTQQPKTQPSATSLITPESAPTSERPTTAWPKRGGVYVATSSEGIPDFPRVLSGFHAARRGVTYFDEPFDSSSGARVSSDRWEGIYQFPVTENQCSAGVFMLRWRSGGGRIATMLGGDTGESYRLNNGVPSVQTGRFGYIYGSNCQQPMFKFVPDRNFSGNIEDVYYEVRFWKAAP